MLRPLVASRKRLNATVGALRRYSLVERDGDQLRAHRLVQTVARDELRERQRGLALDAIQWARDVFGYVAHRSDRPRVSEVPIGISGQLLALGGLPGLDARARRNLTGVLGDLSHFLLQSGDTMRAGLAARASLELSEATPQAQRDLCGQPATTSLSRKSPNKRRSGGADFYPRGSASAGG